MPEITVKDTSVRIMKVDGQDYVCITDVARYKNPAETALIISHWLSSHSTVEFLGIWETLKIQILTLRNSVVLKMKAVAMVLC